MAAGTDDTFLRASLARGARGLIIEGTGCGNVPPAAMPGVRAALAERIPIVLVSRCPEAGRPRYGYEEAKSSADRCIPGATSGPKAAQLMVALSPRRRGRTARSSSATSRRQS